MSERKNTGRGDATIRLISKKVSLKEKEATLSGKQKSDDFYTIFERLCEPKKITTTALETVIGSRNIISKYKSRKGMAKRSTIIEICFGLRQLGAEVTVDDIDEMLKVFKKRQLNTDTAVDGYVTIAASQGMTLSELEDYLYEKGFDLSDLDKS